MISVNDITKALWTAMADNARTTDKMARAGGFDALREFVGQLADSHGIPDDVRDALRLEVARMEAF